MRASGVGHGWATVISEQRLRLLYVKRRLTQKEIGQIVGCSFQPIATALKMYGIPVRDKSQKQVGRKVGNENPAWKGDKARYKALHLRMYTERGAPKKCEVCGTTDKNRRYDWHNLTGAYADPKDYKRLCRTCHNKITHGRT